MKKILFTLVAAALVLVGCEPPTPTTLKGITMETEIAFVLDAGEDFALTVLPVSDNPEEVLDPAQLSFASADEAVVVVSPEGIVSATGLGTTTITATYGEFTAVCNVRVVASPIEILKWGDFYLVGIGQPLSPDTIKLTDNEGTVENCLLHLGQFYFTDANIATDADGKFLGDGYVATCYAPIFLIYGGEYDGYYMGARNGYRFATSLEDALSSYAISETKDIQYAVLPQGISDVDAYTTFIGGLLTGKLTYESPEAEAYATSMPWGGIQEVLFSEGGATYPTEGFLGEGTFVDGANYDFSVNWLNGAYGLNYNITEAGELEIVEPYEFISEPFTVQYTQSTPAESASVVAAPARKLNAKAIQHTTAIVNVK